MTKFTDYFKIVSPTPGTTTMTDNQSLGDQGVYANYTWYQRLIQGSASRLQRYKEYDLMDYDVEVARALDTIAEEMTGNNPQANLPFEIELLSDKDNDIPSNVVPTLNTALSYWCDIHSWETRIFKLCRNVVKYGDCFFLRHKETSKWEYIHPKNVVAAIVDESDITNVVGWQIKKEIKTPNSPYNMPIGHFGGYSEQQVDTYPSDAVIWYSLNDDMSESAPFGESVLRPIYRAQKQKELLEDAIIIYRIQRSPERRVFKIDVGKMPPHRVKSYLEQIKNEIRQKRVPTTGGGVDQVDSVYNPHSMNEDFFFAHREGGRGSTVEVLPGGQGLGELADLEYFYHKVLQGLRIPISYLTALKRSDTGPTTNDGKVGIAYIEELRFALYVRRLQTHIETVTDKEFKRFLRAAGINIDPTIFKVRLPSPENFAVWRQQQLDGELLNTMTNANSIEFLSKRYVLRRFLQMEDKDILENERLLAEERGFDPRDRKGNISKIYRPFEQFGNLDRSPMVAGTLGSDFGFNSSPAAGTGLDTELETPTATEPIGIPGENVSSA